MDRMLVVVFGSGGLAHDGQKALRQLDREGRINVRGSAILERHPDGSATVKQGADAGLLGAMAGTELGSLVGLLGGPTGVAIGAVAGLAAGRAVDFSKARIGQEFIDDVTRALPPGKFAVVAEIEEDLPVFVDQSMEALGGSVFRPRES
jgi:uncharacterized membrane protein